ncbi:M61 family metallopeptidase [Chromobacterium haemolyticum]|uniref:M61 family metallopeptidase n=1 Tax=Chromobacterium haemolyticum TaxID=394935 RepID=A0ABS3GPQ2_9NEIS|nr:PDZ domain-containing protein [Chromobacterium haemolyticum]MBK0416861.1 M61 family metallopeptidase [Chromobacterium haemolyticum]MBO0417014.1 M61 family metallopeptidase [Chromobacterium haemolyticum]MBO0501249.1 M61 family metallopeptidase [Chromobacterium haemolyticum]
MTVSVRYTLCPRAPEAHLFEVVLTVSKPAKNGQIFSLPAWIPGSYMIREFSRHIVEIRAESAGKTVQLVQLTKNSWQAAPVKGVLVLRYKVYAFDLSVRGAYLDAERGFYNGSSVFLAVDGYENEACSVEILPPEGKAYADWKVATSLPARGADKKTGFGGYQAASYDELIDHPVELGAFERVSFKACGVPHEFVVSGRFRADLKRLARDTKKICEYQIKLFGEPAPFERYVFMLFVGKDIYGGLEHRASTALVANRDDLPQQGVEEIGDGYLKLLGLISHEYFHSWNVKRMKPAAFTPYDLNQEGYTRLLWAFEGITSYYDDLSLVRCGLIDEKRYLGLLAETISGVERGAGRLKQTLEQSSFEAWTKYYRQDENSPNSIVSYYTKGALAALALDLIIRRDSQGRQSLDDVMRALWRKWLDDGKGLAEDEWEKQAQAVTGLDLKAFFDQALRGVEPLPLAQLLATQGVELRFEPAANAGDRGGLALNGKPAPASLGVKAVAEAQGVRVINVYDGGAAQRAGLSGGDVIVAIDKLKAVDLDKALARYQPGDKLKLHWFRRDELISAQVELQAAPADACRLLLQDDGARWLRR